MSAAQPPLTAEEIARPRDTAENTTKIYFAQDWELVTNKATVEITVRLCDAAEGAAAKDAEIAKLRQRAERAEADAARYRWAKPILSGDDDETGDERAVVIGLALAQGRDIDDAISDAIAASQPPNEQQTK